MIKSAASVLLRGCWLLIHLQCKSTVETVEVVTKMFSVIFLKKEAALLLAVPIPSCTLSRPLE